MTSRLLRTAGPLFFAGAVLGAFACSSSDEEAPVVDAGADASTPGVPTARFVPAQVERAIPLFEALVKDSLARTGVPGLAYAVVYQDRVVAMAGLGVREVGKPDAVDADTIFQLASVSKPLGSTVMAKLVGEKVVAWDDPVVKHDPSFALGDAWVTAHVTFADLYSHRTGLPDHAGDLLEDLGYDRDAVLQRLRFAPLKPFRATYEYTNFGLTEAAVAAAMAAGKSWEDVSDERLYRPLGMTRTSSRHADYARDPNHASLHVRTATGWSASAGRQPDPQTPAGGVSSSVRDMTRWLRLHLGQGTVDGQPIVDAAALGRTHLPEARSLPPRVYDGRAAFYGLGWNVGATEDGQTQWSHSGAFAMGAATTVTVLPTEGLALVVLTNGQPIGLPEAMSDSFLDLVRDGRPSRDWVAARGEQFAAFMAGPPKEHDYATPPPNAKAPAASEAYVGTYTNAFYGALVVATGAQGLTVGLGPAGTTYPLRAYDGDLFAWDPPGENGTGASGVTFALGADGKASTVRFEHFDVDKIGTFTR